MPYRDPPSEARRRFLLGTTAIGAGIAAVDALAALSPPQRLRDLPITLDKLL